MLVSILVFLIGWAIGDIAHAQTPEDIQSMVQALQTRTANAPHAHGTTLAVLAWLFSDVLELSTFDMILFLGVSGLYNILFVAGNWHATPGKHWLGMKVVMRDGRPLTLPESAIRHTVNAVSMAASGLGYITMFFTREKAALHDLICNTRVIRAQS